MKSLFCLVCLFVMFSSFDSESTNAQNPDTTTKKIRLGLAAVKTVSASEGLDRRQFGAAIENSLSEYLKSPDVEIVVLEAKLPSAIEAEIKEKDIDYLISASAAHKKGGGGFGKMFGSVAPVIGQVAPIAGMGGNVAGAIAGQVAATAIMTAATLSQNVKAKDSIELNVSMQKTSDKSNIFAKQLKAKAKSDGEDIITPLIEQTAQAILDAVTGKTSAAAPEKK